MLDFSLSESQEFMKKTAYEFFLKECPRSLVRKMEDDPTGHSLELWRKMAELGWLGILVPEEYGGAGLDILHMAVLMEEIGRACVPEPFLSTAVVGTSTLLEAANQRQKKELLPRLAKGTLILTLALTEPSATYDPSGIECSATVRNGNYILNGTKLFVPDANIADYLICVVKTDSVAKGGITLLLIDVHNPGITLMPFKTIGGDKQFEIGLNNVTAPREYVLGEPGRGAEYLDKVLQKAAIAKCAEIVGAGQQVVDMTVAYAKERRQFDHPIGSFQAIQHYCANIATDLEAARMITYKAAWMLSEGLPCAKQVSTAKAWCSEAFRKMSAIAMQVHAAVGFINDHDMPLYYRRAKAWELAFGDAEFHRERVAREIGL